MERNRFLGECLCVVCEATTEEVAADHLQSPFIILFIKSRKSLADITTLEALKSGDLFVTTRDILLRVACECLFGVFGDSHCECEAQRVACLREIAREGQGIYVHIPHEAQGNGLFYKAKELQLQVSGVAPDGGVVGQKSVDEASAFLLGGGVPLDKRGYSSLVRIFANAALARYPYTVITDNKDKLGLFTHTLSLTVKGPGLTPRAITADNASEYLAKLYMKGFGLNNTELEQIYLALFNADRIPGRVLGLLHRMAEDMHHGITFQADPDWLKKIVDVAKARGLTADSVTDIDALRDVSSYEEYQVELALSPQDVAILFDKRILMGIDSLRYEENHFYDLALFEGIPTRSLKIRYAYRLSDRYNPVECKFIYKVPLRDKVYRIRSLLVGYNDIAKVLGFVLRDYEQHLLPVFTHNVIGPDSKLTTLLKRYTRSLITVSLMGPEENVKRVIDTICGVVTASEIPDPSNALFLDRRLSTEFDYEALAEEELALFKKHMVA